MNRVEKAIETGRCALAVSGSLLRDAEVMLALSERAALSPMALAGPAVSPVIPVSADGIARAVAQPGGVVVVVEPQGADTPGLAALGKLLQRGRHKPDIVVISRSYNPFAFGTALQGLRVNHEKGRGKAFIQALPEPPEGVEVPGAAEAVAKVKKKGADATTRFCFTGREEEVAALAEQLGAPGPLVVSGPSGIGRHQLLEHAIAAAGLARLPDVWLGHGTGFDALINRLAAAAKDAGHDALFELLKGEHTPASAIEAALAAVAHEGLAGKILVIHRLEFGLGREQDFFRKGRLEMLLHALLTHPAALPIAFVSTRQPHFHREGEGEPLRRVEVGGIKGRFFHEIFEAYQAVELPRDKFGPISERLHGHPLAARTFAIATRVRADGEKLADDPKFMKTDDAADLAPLRKQLGKRVEKLPKDLRATLARIAHLPEPVDGQTLSDLRINRKDRLELLSLGLLDMYGTLEGDRRYRVHPLVRAHLTWREISDFDTSAELAELYAARSRKAEGAEKVACEHIQSRFAIQGRVLRLRPKTELPDHDAWLESVIGMMRAKNPRLDLVEQRLNECLKQNPANADAWLLKLELSSREGGKADAIEAVFEEAVVKAPVPELFQQVTSSLLGRRQRNKAIPLLEKGVELFPGESRLRTRLAAILFRQGRRNEGIDHLRTAMEQDPMLPDAYGLLGMARRDEGVDAIADAEQLLREAVRLAPGDPVQTARLADLLIERARVDLDHQKALREEAHELLEEGIRGERRAPEACLLLATLVREEGGDLERAAWLLKQARKVTDRGHERSRRISVERALLDMAQGNLDQAENTIRQRIEKDPTHAAAFAALGHILEVREQYVPAHAEYLRARDRAAQNSLEAQYYGQLLTRVQAIIEAQAAGLWQQSSEEQAAPEPSPAAFTPMHPSGRVIRRSRTADEPAPAPAPEVEPEPEPEPAAAEPEPAFEPEDPAEAPTEIED